MSEDNPITPPHPESEPRVDYHRVISSTIPDPTTDPASAPPRRWTQGIAPTLVPLIAGLMLLLILIFMLGLLSLRRMDEVSVAVSDLEQQNAAKLRLLLKLRLGVTKLNNEARARAESEARDEIRPPIDLRLSVARDELNELVEQLGRSTLTADPSWQNFMVHLKAFSEVTEDLRRYSLEGFGKFDVVDKELNAFLSRAGDEHEEVDRKNRIIEQNAANSIRSWTTIALIFGAFVAAGTIWEVQRRFGQMRKSVREASREREFTSQLLEGMVSAVAAIDDDDRIRSANAPFFRIFPGASIGASVRETFASPEAAQLLEAATATRVDTASYRGRWVSASLKGEQEQTFDIYSSPLAIDGGRGQILTLVDATEAVEAERGLRRQESLAAVGQATAQVAHEIRNPLGSIRLGVSMLRDSVSDADGLHTIDLVERGIKHLNKLVVDVTQFSSRKALDRSSANLHDLIDRSLELVADKIKEKGTVIEKNFTDEKLVGNWDPDQLRQVLVNVIANAIDASPEKSPVSITTAVTGVGQTVVKEMAPGRNARVTIADRGKGIEQAVLDRIFEPFFSTKKRGTGLGLAIVKQIVEQHGGTVTVESKLGEGTSFVIELPL